MVGVAIYELSGYQGDPACAWIALLMIAEPFQRQGYGAEACRIIENEILGNLRVQTIKLGVLANNQAALAFWNEMGYRKTGTRECRETGQNLIIMQKPSSASAAAKDNNQPLPVTGLIKLPGFQLENLIEEIIAAQSQAAGSS